MDKTTTWSMRHPVLSSLLSIVGMFIPVYWPDTKHWGGTISVVWLPIGTWMILIALAVDFVCK